MDMLDASILNIALPSIKRDLGFSQQSLQWVVDGYILTYGGFLLLGGRDGRSAGPPPRPGHRAGRLRRLVAGRRPRPQRARCSSAPASPRESVRRCSRRRRSRRLTSTFRSTRDRNTALGVWAAVSGIGGAAGVLFGGLLTEGPGWRWVLFVNVPFSAVALVGAFALLKPRARRARRLANFDALGAFLVTGGMLLLVYALVKAPDVGWGAGRTIAGLAGAAVILAAFVVNELRVRQPARPALDPARQGSRCRRRHADGRPGRLPADVLLPDALHADACSATRRSRPASPTCR